MTNDKLIGKLVLWALTLGVWVQGYSSTWYYTSECGYHIAKTLIISKDFSEAKQNFDQIPVVHVSYAFSYLALLQCNLVEHPIVDIWEDLDILKFL
jgi:hypothetical protein